LTAAHEAEGTDRHPGGNGEHHGAVESIDEYFRRVREACANAEASESMRAVGAMIVSGRCENFTIEAEI